MSVSELHTLSWGDRGDVHRDVPFLVDLRDPLAGDPAVTGGKAAALATAAAAGLATLPGVVLTTAFSRAVDAKAKATESIVRDAFLHAGGDAQALVVRSSSVIEDTAESSMAGQFASVIGVRGVEEFAAAVHAVLDSRQRAGAADLPIGVLIQPLLEPALGGVLFGIDPVTRRSDRRVVSAVHGGPEPLVSGMVSGSRYVLDPDGRAVDVTVADGPKLARRHLRRLAALSDEVARVFGGPQDVEWAIGDDGRVWLLQSRPVTTEVRGTPSGPVYGPGPVAETLPPSLSELEVDLWVPPLRDAVREAVLLAGTATRRELARTDVVIAIDGHVAIDLRLAGEIPRKGSNALRPWRAAARVGGSAWRVGRLRAAMPKLAERVLERADADLTSVPSLRSLGTTQLVALVHRSQEALRALHAHEILMGMLVDMGEEQVTGAAVALHVLDEQRRQGVADADIIDGHPVVLALTAPRVSATVELPDDVDAMNLAAVGDGAVGDPNGILREALRLRVRWVQELSARAAWALGERLAAAGDLPEPAAVRHLTLEQLEAIVAGRANGVIASLEAHAHNDGAPLPARFQLSDRGRAIEVRGPQGTGVGTGAGGGYGEGPVTYDAVDPPAGAVLVTTTLSPGLGPLLPRLRGIVAETGSVLSHLAILAREAGVPTVVGYLGAARELPEGALVSVDGDTGRVTLRGEEAA